MTAATTSPPAKAGKILNYIGRHNIRGDFFGGLTAAVIALPMALAFGVASGAGAAAGLWSAAIIGMVTALFGGTPALISEPTGPMTVVFSLSTKPSLPSFPNVAPPWNHLGPLS